MSAAPNWLNLQYKLAKIEPPEPELQFELDFDPEIPVGKTATSTNNPGSTSTSTSSRSSASAIVGVGVGGSGLKICQGHRPTVKGFVESIEKRGNNGVDFGLSQQYQEKLAKKMEQDQDDCLGEILDGMMEKKNESSDSGYPSSPPPPPTPLWETFPKGNPMKNDHPDVLSHATISVSTHCKKNDQLDRLSMANGYGKRAKLQSQGGDESSRLKRKFQPEIRQVIADERTTGKVLNTVGKEKFVQQTVVASIHQPSKSTPSKIPEKPNPSVKIIIQSYEKMSAGNGTPKKSKTLPALARLKQEARKMHEDPEAGIQIQLVFSKAQSVVPISTKLKNQKIFSTSGGGASSNTLQRPIISGNQNLSTTPPATANLVQSTASTSTVGQVLNDQKIAGMKDMKLQEDLDRIRTMLLEMEEGENQTKEPPQEGTTENDGTANSQVASSEGEACATKRKKRYYWCC